MTDFAELSLVVKSSGATRTRGELERLAQAADKAESSIKSLSAATGNIKLSPRSAQAVKDLSVAMKELASVRLPRNIGNTIGDVVAAINLLSGVRLPAGIGSQLSALARGITPLAASLAALPRLSNTVANGIINVTIALEQLNSIRLKATLAPTITALSAAITALSAARPSRSFATNMTAVNAALQQLSTINIRASLARTLQNIGVAFTTLSNARITAATGRNVAALVNALQQLSTIRIGPGLTAAINAIARLSTAARAAAPALRILGAALANAGGSAGPLNLGLGKLLGFFGQLGIVVSFGAAIRYVYTTLKEFDAALAGVQKTTNLSQQGLDIMSDRVLALSRVIPVGASEMLNLAQVAGQLGVRGVQNLSTFAETIARLNVATSDLKGEQAALSLARLLSLAGESPDKVDELASVIVKLGNNMAVTEGELVRVATRLAQSTSVFRFSSAQVAALGAAMRELGVRAELGGTGIGRVMSRLSDSVRAGGKSLEIVAQIARTTNEDFAKKFNETPFEALLDFIKGVGTYGTDAVSALEAININGIEFQTSILPLAANFGTVEKAMRLMNEELGTTNELSRESERAFKTLGSRVEVLKNTFQAGILSYKESSGALAQFADTVAQAVAILFELPDATSRATKEAKLLANALKMAGVITAIIGIVVAVRALRTALTALVATVNPVVAALALLAFTISSIGVLLNNDIDADPLVNGIRNIGGALQTAEEDAARFAKGWDLYIGALRNGGDPTARAQDQIEGLTESIAALESRRKDVLRASTSGNAIDLRVFDTLGMALTSPQLSEASSRELQEYSLGQISLSEERVAQLENELYVTKDYEFVVSELEKKLAALQATLEKVQASQKKSAEAIALEKWAEASESVSKIISKLQDQLAVEREIDSYRQQAGREGFSENEAEVIRSTTVELQKYRDELAGMKDDMGNARFSEEEVADAVARHRDQISGLIRQLNTYKSVSPATVTQEFTEELEKQRMEAALTASQQGLLLEKERTRDAFIKKFMSATKQSIDAATEAYRQQEEAINKVVTSIFELSRVSLSKFAQDTKTSLEEEIALLQVTGVEREKLAKKQQYISELVSAGYDIADAEAAYETERSAIEALIDIKYKLQQVDKLERSTKDDNAKARFEEFKRELDVQVENISKSEAKLRLEQQLLDLRKLAIAAGVTNEQVLKQETEAYSEQYMKLVELTQIKSLNETTQSLEREIELVNLTNKEYELQRVRLEAIAEAQRAGVDTTSASFQASLDAMIEKTEQLYDKRRYAQLADGVAGAITQPIESFILGVQSAEEAVMALINNIQQVVVRTLVTDPLTDVLSSQLKTTAGLATDAGEAATGAGQGAMAEASIANLGTQAATAGPLVNALGTAANAATSETAAVVPAMVKLQLSADLAASALENIGLKAGISAAGAGAGAATNAKGNLIKFANGGVLHAPHYFGMGDGRLGVAGEAGPEAAFAPLKRMASGNLGVEVSGSGGKTVNLNVTQNFNGPADADAMRYSQRQLAKRLRNI